MALVIVFFTTLQTHASPFNLCDWLLKSSIVDTLRGGKLSQDSQVQYRSIRRNLQQASLSEENAEKILPSLLRGYEAVERGLLAKVFRELSHAEALALLRNSLNLSYFNEFPMDFVDLAIWVGQEQEQEARRIFAIFISNFINYDSSQNRKTQALQIAFERRLIKDITLSAAQEFQDFQSQKNSRNETPEERAMRFYREFHESSDGPIDNYMSFTQAAVLSLILEKRLWNEVTVEAVRKAFVRYPEAQRMIREAVVKDLNLGNKGEFFSRYLVQRLPEIKELQPSELNSTDYLVNLRTFSLEDPVMKKGLWFFDLDHAFLHRMESVGNMPMAQANEEAKKVLDQLYKNALEFVELARKSGDIRLHRAALRKFKEIRPIMAFGWSPPKVVEEQLL